eukprot:CAMPEP_0113966384 /NCGR_PEP_ID=MMETSP0011_2-20120614/8300_1 /TAXON_ID=101924 /ORGANISM="Rhodosorus marinus" /LENGTH=220 /DNA_ID=CAMNT_0000979061 /DNA_START=213 /DNA_END=872 /DNA_ORIENTATION=- /assembly_acc=CAM_ASM_000156
MSLYYRLKAGSRILRPEAARAFYRSTGGGLGSIHSLTSGLTGGQGYRFKQFPAAAGLRWHSAFSPTRKDEKDSVQASPKSKKTPTQDKTDSSGDTKPSAVQFSTAAVDVKVSNETAMDHLGDSLPRDNPRVRVYGPHILAFNAELHNMISISSRIGALFLSAIIFLPVPSFWVLVVEHVPIGPVVGMMVFSVMSMMAHLLFLAQWKFVSKFKWGAHSDKW